MFHEIIISSVTTILIGAIAVSFPHIQSQMLFALIGLLLFVILVELLLKMITGKTRLRTLRNGYGRAWLVLPAILTVTCFLVFIVQSDVLTKSSEMTTEPKDPRGEHSLYFYGIMFDAGSTGSRIHVFRFTKSDGYYQLVDELFEQVKPGLSSFADRPKEGAETLRSMLNNAKKFIPKNQWSETPIGLKATAGLRLLSNETAQRLLDEVSELFQSYPFQMADNSVSILEGADEGLFCWFTINFLHGIIGNSSPTLGVLDLGGGSTQITFHVASKKGKAEDRIVAAKVFDDNMTLYSHSYLGLGLMSGRFQILGGRETPHGIESGTFHSPCLPDNHTDTWKHGGKEHTLRGIPAVSSSRFEDCYSIVHKIIKSSNIDQPEDMKKTEFYAISYYVDRATDIDLLDLSSGGGKLTVQEFFDAAKKECSNVSKKDMFSCMDMCFISALLHDGLGLHKTSKLLLGKKIRDVEIAWPLGAMFDVYGQFRRFTS